MLRQLSACRPRVLPPAKMTPARHSSFKKTKRKNAREKTEQEREALRSAFGGGRPSAPEPKTKDPDAGPHVHDTNGHVFDWGENEHDEREREALRSAFGGGRPHTPRRKPKDPDARSHAHESHPDSHAHVIDWKNTEWEDTEQNKRERDALRSAFSSRPSAPNREAKDPETASHALQRDSHAESIGHVINWAETEWREAEQSRREKDALQSIFGRRQRETKDPDAGSTIHESRSKTSGHALDEKETGQGQTAIDAFRSMLHSHFNPPARRPRSSAEDPDAGSHAHESQPGSQAKSKETDQSKIERRMMLAAGLEKVFGMNHSSQENNGKRERDAPGGSVSKLFALPYSHAGPQAEAKDNGESSHHPHRATPDHTAHQTPSRGLWGYTSRQFLSDRALNYTATYREFRTEEMKYIAKRIMFPRAARVFLEKAAETPRYRDIRASVSSRSRRLIFRLHFDDGLEIENKGDTRSLRLANRVAMMALARSLGVPVPKVLRYDCTQDNPIGWPFIAFEEPDGSEINIWTDLNDDERLKLADELADIEARFLSFKLPGFGAIYFSRDLPLGCPSFPIPDRDDLKGLCVGPYCTRKWRFQGHEPGDGGPFINPEVFIYNNTIKNTLAVLEDGPIVHGDKKQNFSLQHCKLYGDYLKIVDHLLPRIITAISTPRLSAYELLRTDFRHVNFTQSRNVKIAAITDSFSGMAQPHLLAWGTHRMRRSELRSSKPRMPRQPETISHKRQELIAKQLMDWRQGMMDARFFDKIKHIEESHSILSIPKWQILRELLTAVRSRHSARLNHLHAALINVTEHWDDITRTKDGHAPPCPISYSEEEKKSVLREQERNGVSAEETSFISKITEANVLEGVVSFENYNRIRDYVHSTSERVKANDGKYYPDVDDSDSTEEAFETPDEFETVLCKRMGISRATFWRSVADITVWKKNNSLNQRDGYFEEKSRVGRSEQLGEKEQQIFEKEEEKEKKKHFDSISHLIGMMK